MECVRIVDALSRTLKALLVPQGCALCGVWTLNDDLSPLCRSCLSSFRRLPRPLCHFCGAPTPGCVLEGFAVCRMCRASPQPFDYVRAGGLYEGSLRRALRRYKFDGFQRLAAPLAGFMLEALLESGLELDFDWVVAVPSHARRRRQRGFDHTGRLARALSADLAAPVFKKVRRKRDTAPQFGLNREQRRRNLRGAFEVSGPERLRGSRILLIDDILTTGATVAELCRLLRNQARPKLVFVLVAARPQLTLF